jgi:broad specificity phosphatase PhoE
VSTLYLIRHGQASFLQADYDILSPLGAEQSQALGGHVADDNWRLDALYSGPRKRQLDTADHLRRGAALRGHALPAIEVVDEFDEFPFQAMMARLLPQLAQREPELTALIGNAGRRQPPDADQRRRLTGLIEEMTTRWSRGELDLGADLETYADFRQRVSRGLDRVMTAQGRGKRVAVVTSGGPISITVRRCLGLDHEVTWQMAWTVRNASISEFRYREDRLSLVAFNNVPHLRGEQITYR